VSNVKAVTDATFKDEVLSQELPTLVDFTADWCPPCRMLAPIIDELSEEFEGRIKFVSLNTDENPAYPMEYDVYGLPTLLLFRSGEVAETLVGFRPKGDLKRRLEAAIATTAEKVR
jgi:thioredoxin 1